jgi:hypothetical protein
MAPRLKKTRPLGLRSGRAEAPRKNRGGGHSPRFAGFFTGTCLFTITTSVADQQGGGLRPARRSRLPWPRRNRPSGTGGCSGLTSNGEDGRAAMLAVRPATLYNGRMVGSGGRIASRRGRRGDTMRRRFLLVVGLFACLFCGASLYVMWQPSYTPGVTPENFRRLHKGMTRDEVQAILGGPGSFQQRGTDSFGEKWHGEHCCIFLWFQDWAEVTVDSGSMTTQDGSRVYMAEDRADPRFWAFIRRILGR